MLRFTPIPICKAVEDDPGGFLTTRTQNPRFQLADCALRLRMLAAQTKNKKAGEIRALQISNPACPAERRKIVNCSKLSRSPTGATSKLLKIIK